MPGRRAFTLVELLTVIAIIGLLAGIAVPTALKMRQDFMRSASLATLNLLDTACKEYHKDMGVYPPSDPVEISGQRYFGRHWLVQCLIGYFPDLSDDNNPDAGATTSAGRWDDGQDGLGFRMQDAPSTVYGPYAGAENVQTIEEKVYYKNPSDFPDACDPRLVFVDGFEEPIFYYRFGSGYQRSDNYDTNNRHGPSNLTEYAQTESGAYFRKDFILCTPGPDDKWESYREDSETDDVTNFLKE